MGRIALTEPLLRNAGLQEGDSVELYFDAATKVIVVERSPVAEPQSAGVPDGARKKTR